MSGAGSPRGGARGLPWAQRACALTHHLTSVNLKIVNLKIRWFFFLFFTTKIIDGIQVFWFISQFGKKIPT